MGCWQCHRRKCLPNRNFRSGSAFNVADKPYGRQKRQGRRRRQGKRLARLPANVRKEEHMRIHSRICWVIAALAMLPLGVSGCASQRPALPPVSATSAVPVQTPGQLAQSATPNLLPGAAGVPQQQAPQQATLASYQAAGTQPPRSHSVLPIPTTPGTPVPESYVRTASYYEGTCPDNPKATTGKCACGMH